MSTGAAGAALVGFVAGTALEAAVVGRLRRERDPAAPVDLGPVPGTIERVVTTDDGGSIHLLDSGPTDAPTVVFVHGVTLSAAVWRHQFQDLAGDRRVIAIDQRGHGRSIPGDDGYSFARLAADVGAVLVDLDLRDVTLVGHSMGGMVVQRLAMDWPALFRERVGALVLMSTSAGAGFGLPFWDAAMTLVTPPSQKALRWLAGHPRRYFPSTDLSFLLARAALGRRPSPTDVEFTRAMTAATSPLTVAALTGELGAFDHRDALAHITVPSAVVVGSRDFLTPPRQARRLAHAIPGVELVTMEGSGHMPMLERRQEVAALVRRLLPGAAAAP